jgi:hypothetical protein
MGMVNQAWYAFEDWVDKCIEIIHLHDKEARKELIFAEEKLKEAEKETMEIGKEINIKVHERNGGIKAIKSEL